MDTLQSSCGRFRVEISQEGTPVTRYMVECSWKSPAAARVAADFKRRGIVVRDIEFDMAKDVGFPDWRQFIDTKRRAEQLARETLVRFIEHMIGAPVLIVACGATKRHDAGELPAVERYDGPIFRMIRSAPSTPEIHILSARFGLIPAAQPIPDYDQRLTPERAAEIAGDPEQAARVRAVVAGRRTICLAGADYAQLVRQLAGDATTIDYRGGSYLRQVSTLAAILKNSPAATTPTECQPVEGPQLSLAL